MNDTESNTSSPPASPAKPANINSNNQKDAFPDDRSSIHSQPESDVNVSRQLNFGTDDSMTVQFVPPTEGTPAALALAANAQIKVSGLERLTHKFRTMKRPKLKSLNIVKKLNKTTKTRRKERHFSKNFKGKVIDGVHELYTLTAGMMLGIRFSLSQSRSPTLTHDDFEFVENVAFPPKGNPTPPITPPHSLAHTFKFKSYSPNVFQKIREFYDIDRGSYMNSVCGDYNFVEFISNSKSGQFFFYSHDGKYMLKTQTKEENKFLKEILPRYYEYIKQNPHSFVVRILGMHRIKMYHLRRKVHFVVMASVFDTPAQINTIYDLKGSLVGRSATPKEKESGGVLKDCDLVEAHRKFHLGKKRRPFLQQLQKDAKFLASLDIMDYSLLVGIHDRNSRQLLGKIEVPHTATDASVQSESVEHNSQQGETNPSHHHTVNAATGNAEAGDPMVVSTVGTRSNTPFRRASITGQAPSTLSDTPAQQLTAIAEEEISASRSKSSSQLKKKLSEHESRSATSDLEEEDGDDEDEEEEQEEEFDEEEVEYVYDEVDAGDSDAEGNPATDSRLHPTHGEHFGNGITVRAPWTTRLDGGINSHSGDKRLNEIYFLGIIDILQEYNASKKMETMFKGLTHDVRQISSVDPVTYARRFIQFLEANTD